MINQKDVSIVIPYWGKNPEERYAFKECLTSLLETCECPIVVALNGGLISHEEIDTSSGRVSVVEVDKQGQCVACNVGVAFTNTPWIMITNDDMIYPPGWFERLTANIVNPIVVGSIPCCISPKLVEPRPGAPTFETFFCGGAGGDFNKSKFLEFADNWAIKTEPLITGFNLPFLIKRELWDVIGGYDENYDPFGSNSDSDLQAKIHLAGVQTYQNTNCVIYHFGTTSGTSHPDNRSFWDRNWHYFIDKWGFERQSSPMVWKSENIINYDKLKYKPDWVGKYGPVQ